MSENEWTPVMIRGRRAPATAAKRPTVSAEVAAHRRADAEDLPMAKRVLAPESRQLIVQKRIALKWSQGELDKQCCFPQHTMREIEAGRAVPSPAQLNTLNRTLQVALKYAKI